MSALQSWFPTDVFLSDESSRFVAQVRRLALIGCGVPTSLIERRIPMWPTASAHCFYSLAETWQRECAHLSSLREMVLHPAYQQIIGMGRYALPFLLRELENKPDHWGWALCAITGENPVPPEHRGRLADIARDWLEWARNKGLQ
jgi:hypothetical protein